MTPVKNPSGSQYGIHGKNRNGEPTMLWISNEVSGKTHFRIGSCNTWIDTEDLKEALAKLYPLQGARHAGTM